MIATTSVDQDSSLMSPDGDKEPDREVVLHFAGWCSKCKLPVVLQFGRSGWLDPGTRVHGCDHVQKKFSKMNRKYPTWRKMGIIRGSNESN